MCNPRTHHPGPPSSALRRGSLLQADTEIIAERTKLMEEWKSWYQSKKQWLDWFEAGREDLLGDGAREGEYTVEEVIAEVPLGAQEEVLRN